MSLVSICMITFNHEKYINKAVEGVLNQETSFDYELVLVNDCSTDQTTQIIENIISSNSKQAIIKYFFQKKNIGANASFSFAIKQSLGKYIAICEGDDYWTDPKKLQKQVDFLEANTDYGMVHTDADVLFQNTGVLRERYNFSSGWDIPDGYIFEKLLRGIFIKTLTAVIRKDLVEKYHREIKCEHWTVGDLPLFLYTSRHSKVKYFNYSTGVYRILDKSATHQESPEKRAGFLKGLYDIEFVFAEKYGCSEATRNYILKIYNERKVEIGFYDFDSTTAREGLGFLKKSKNISIRYFLLYLGSRKRLIQFTILKVMEFKKYIRIVFKQN